LSSDTIERRRHRIDPRVRELTVHLPPATQIVSRSIAVAGSPPGHREDDLVDWVMNSTLST
jgi:hypothetical protein